MIVVKDLRVDVLGEPLFEKVNLVMRSGERVGVVGLRVSDVKTFLRVIAGKDEVDEGSVTHEGERLAYISPEDLQGETDSLAQILHAKPSFLIINANGLDDSRTAEAITQLISGFSGGILLASEDVQLMQVARVTRVLEIHPSTRSVSSYTGNFASYTVAREENQARTVAAYEKQQKEKRRLEEWLDVKRKEAAVDRSPEKGATIRSKKKYLQREILEKEIPKPFEAE